MKYLILLTALFQFGLFNSIVASEKDSLTSSSILYEKVYLHIDRELYAPEDNIWFKSYLVSGINNKLIPGYKNIYVELVSESGEVKLTRLLLSKDGVAHGDFHLYGSLPEGKYMVRAYTKYLQNFGEESFFHKKIMISKAKNSLEQIRDAEKEKQKTIDVAFLPESGDLVLNAINYIAFKAIDATGKGISVKGKIVDESGNEVVSFKSSYKGMGKFIMMPQEDKSYFAMVDGYPEFNYQFKPAKSDGVSLNYKPDGNYLQFTLTRNLKINSPQDFLLTASHKGIELFNSQITMTEFQHAQRLYKGLFPLGISKVSLYNSNGNIVAERLVFVRNSNDKSVEIDLNKEEYKTRDKVEMDISSLLPENDTITSTLSVAVVHEDYFSSTGNTQTIESYLLLDSDLKGSVESPASCFIDENNISADEKLDLIMMVNGWRNYYWNDLEQYKGVKLPNWDDYGLSIKGNVTKEWGGKPAENAKVVIGPFSSGFLLEETTADANGNFDFDRLYLKDSALIMINAKTKKGSKRTEIKLEPQINFDDVIETAYFKRICPDIDVPLKFYRENYYRHLAEQEFKIKTGILLDEVTTVGKKPGGDGHFRLYGEPDISLKITDEDQNYFSVLDYLEMKSLPGIVVVGDEIRIRGSQQNPLLLVDGLTTDWDAMINTPMGDIDKIEILKSGYSTAVYGSKGGDGVISILTKMGLGEWENNWERIIHGRITPRVQGFKQAREFYSPKYTAATIDDERPDNRPTLFWNPDVKVENGIAKVEFFTADNFARYKVIVEGISKNGRICYATNLLTVSILGKLSLVN